MGTTDGRARFTRERARSSANGGKLPPDASRLREISGIGRYTAGAIASIAFGAPEPLVDGNVARVLARIYAVKEDVRSPAGTRGIPRIAGELVPRLHPGRHNEALMELGAMVCLPTLPRCSACPVADLCRARALGLEKTLPIAKKKRAPREVAMLALVSRKGDRALVDGAKRAAFSPVFGSRP